MSCKLHAPNKLALCVEPSAGRRGCRGQGLPVREAVCVPHVRVHGGCRGVLVTDTRVSGMD